MVNLEEELVQLISDVRTLGPSREISLTVTKLEEALFWLRADQERNLPSVSE